MRRFKICEEKGSGIDKVIKSIEIFQLPAPNFLEYDNGTKVIIYSYKKLNEMDRDDKLRACYQHACLQYVSGEKMTNESLRARFNIEKKNAAIASRILSDATLSGLIKEYQPKRNSLPDIQARQIAARAHSDPGVDPPQKQQCNPLIFQQCLYLLNRCPERLVGLDLVFYGLASVKDCRMIAFSHNLANARE